MSALRDGSTLTTPGRALGQVRRTPVEVAYRDARGEHRLLVRETTVLGSAEGAQLRIDDPTVSRLHAEISFRESGPWIVDLGSRNGTHVDGLQIEAALLPERATVRVGQTTLEVRHARPDYVVLWPEESFGPLIGATPPMRELFARLSRVARSEATALVTGETGTGKELAARAIHEASARAKGPFVTVDCTAVPESLFESELFGHAKGSFTGATSSREGAIEAADGGTLFLDEIGELPASMQPKLLRALEQKSVRRVGESQHRSIDVRFVAATHRNLAELVTLQSFREDLYFRLAVLLVDMPPLRARKTDIPLLAQRFVREGEGPLTPSLLQWMSEQPWRGNVRELRNFVERAVALGEGEARSLQDRGPAGTSSEPLPSPPIDRAFKDVRDEWMAHLEKEYLRGWLARTEGNLTQAADAMGLNRTYVHRLVKKHGLDR
jgi:DNA-binding NtrC family response regulator